MYIYICTHECGTRGQPTSFCDRVSHWSQVHEATTETDISLGAKKQTYIQNKPIFQEAQYLRGKDAFITINTVLNSPSYA